MDLGRRCLRIVLALALACGGFFAPVAMAHAKHHHAHATACCDGVDCECGCTMHAGAPVVVDVAIARLPPEFDVVPSALAPAPAPRDLELRPPIR